MNVAEQQNSKKYCHKSVGIGIGNTFCQSIVIGIDSSFRKCCLRPWCKAYIELGWSGSTKVSNIQ